MKDMDLLLVDRKGDVAEVERIIDWSQVNEFWRSNILSPAKLRKQFTQLVVKAKAPTAPTNGISQLDQKRLAAVDRLTNGVANDA